MTVLLRRGPSGLPPQQAAPQQADQAQLRAARRAHHLHTYGPDWSLAIEVAQITEPLARQVAGRPSPEFYLAHVDELIDACTAAVKCAALMIARAGAARRTAHLPIEERGRAIRRLIDETPRPKRPQITGKALKSGTWALVCTELARPYSGPLSTLLANAAPERRASMEPGGGAAGYRSRGAHPGTQAGRGGEVCSGGEAASDRATDARRNAWSPGVANCISTGLLDGTWGAEIEAIFRPLARQAAACSQPSSLITDINTVIDATHESISEIAVLVAKADAGRAISSRSGGPAGCRPPAGTGSISTAGVARDCRFGSGPRA